MQLEAGDGPSRHTLERANMIPSLLPVLTLVTTDVLETQLLLRLLEGSQDVVECCGIVRVFCVDFVVSLGVIIDQLLLLST